MDNNFIVTSEDLDISQKLESLAKNIAVMLLPSSLWATHIDPNYEYIAILHTQLSNHSKIITNKGIVITYNEDYQCLNTSVYIQNEIVSLPILQYTVRTISDLTHMLYSLEQLILCQNSDKKLDSCLMYLKPNEFGKLCINCRIDKEYFDEIDNSEIIPNESSILEDSFTPKPVSDNYDKKEPCEKEVYSEDNVILCNICGKLFCKTYGLENHLQTHSDVKPFECNICFKTYSSKKNLKIHIETHEGNRPYSCKICNKTFTTPSNLSTHIKSLHKKKKPHACVMCGMSFLYPQLLKIHMRKHTGERPYHCSICGKSFTLNVHLTIHTRTHTGEKPFICSICGKGFTTTGNLRSHKKVHSKENG